MGTRHVGHEIDPMNINSLTIAVTNEYDPGYQAPRPRRKLRLDMAQIELLIDQAAELGARLVILTGGEPFLLGPVLRQAVSYAAEAVGRVRVVTDCYWATTPNQAVVEMNRLAQAGLREIDIRCGDWHQETKWQHRAKWAAWAAGRAGMTVLSKQLVENSKTGSHMIYLRQYPSVGPEAYRATIQSDDSTGDLHPSGLLPYYPEGKETSRRNPLSGLGDDSGRCPYLFNSITAHPDGRLTACGGYACAAAPDLDLGDWYTGPLARLIELGERRPVLQWIRISGPAAIRDAITEKSPGIQFQQHYANVCHLCGDMLTRYEVRRAIHASADLGVHKALDGLIEKLENMAERSSGQERLADISSRNREAGATLAFAD